MRGFGGAVAVTAALLALAGCNKGLGDRVEDEALQAIGESVAATLNEPGAAIVQLLKSVNRPTPIAAEALQITLDQKAVPVDWWLVRHGYVMPITPPPSPDRPTFLVAPGATPLMEQGAVWFTAGAGTPSNVDCHSPEATAAGGCEVEVEITPSFTEAGTALAGSNALPAIKVRALVANGAEGWQVRELRAEGVSLHDFALNVLMGDEQARANSRQQVLSMIGGANLGSAAAAPESSAFAPAPAPLPTPLDTTPVAPVIGDTPYAPKKGL